MAKGGKQRTSSRLQRAAAQAAADDYDEMHQASQTSPYLNRFQVLDPDRSMDVEPRTRTPHVNTHLINLMPGFSGKASENIRYFLNQFEKVADMAGIHKSQRTIILRAKLSGKAQEWLGANDLVQYEDDYDVLCEELIAYFERKKNLMQDQTEFLNITQTPIIKVRELGQSIKNSGFRLFNATEQTPEALENFSNTILLGKFVAALRRDIRKEVKKARITTLDEAIDLAEHLESVLEEDPEAVNAIASSDSSAPKRELTPRWDIQAAQMNNVQMNRTQCYFCGEFDHWVAACPKRKQENTPKQQNREVVRMCIACGSTGHRWNSCFQIREFSDNMKKANEMFSQMNIAHQGNFNGPRHNTPDNFQNNAHPHQRGHNPPNFRHFSQQNPQRLGNNQSVYRGPYRGNRRGNGNFFPRQRGGAQNRHTERPQLPPNSAALAIGYEH